jgi:formylglycine-generating enzyme required for sulfatase activity
MIGNVWEWTRSLWGVQENRPIYQYPYNPFDGRENKLAGDDNFRIIRGGSFNSTIDHVYSACRNLLSPKYKHDRTGIRIVISPQKN